MSGWRNSIPSACGYPIRHCAVPGVNHSTNRTTRDRCSLSGRTSGAETGIRTNAAPVRTTRLRLVDKRLCHVSRGHAVSEAESVKRGECSSFGRQPPSSSEAMTVASTNVICNHSLDPVGVIQTTHQANLLHNKDMLFSQKGNLPRGLDSRRSNIADERSSPVSGLREIFERRNERTRTSTSKQCGYLSSRDSPFVIDHCVRNSADSLGHTCQYSGHLEKYKLDVDRLCNTTVHETQLSPVTISSGYESDYIPSPTLPTEINSSPSRETLSFLIGGTDERKARSDNKTLNVTRRTGDPNTTEVKITSDKTAEVKRTGGKITEVKRTGGKTADRSELCSQSDTYPSSDTGTKFRTKRFSSLRRHPEKRRVSDDVNNRNFDPLVLFSLRYELDTQCAKSHKQNHKLAKVARSMYEIIHDLRKQTYSGKSKRQMSDSSLQCPFQGTDRPRFSPISTRDMNTRGDVCQSNDDDSEGYLKPRPVVDVIHVTDVVEDDQLVNSSRSNTSHFCDGYNQINKPCYTQEPSTILQPSGNGVLETNVQCVSQPGDKKIQIVSQDRKVLSLNTNLRVPLHCVKSSDPLSDSDHIYETIPGDENMIHVIPHQENSKLAKWSTIPNLTGSTSSIPPALPERRYNKGSSTDISTPKSVSQSSPTDHTTHADSVRTPATCSPSCSDNVSDNAIYAKSVKPSVIGVCSSTCLDQELDNDIYAKVCKLSKTSEDNVLSCLGVPLMEEEPNIDDDGLYAKVVHVEQLQMGSTQRVPLHVYITDVSSENYCRLEPMRAADDIHEWSSGDVLNYIDGIHENNSPKRRENILQLLGNSSTCAKLSESLEIETRLLHKGLLFSAWDDDDNNNVIDMVSSSDAPIVLDICHLAATYV